MNGERSITSIPGLAIAVALIISTLIGGWFFVKGKRGDQTITVTGSARQRIKSDLVIWKSGISYQAPVLADAYRSLSESVPKVKAFLKTKLLFRQFRPRRYMAGPVTGLKLRRSPATHSDRSWKFVPTRSTRLRRLLARQPNSSTREF